MTETQKRLWKRMIRLIQDYDHGRLVFRKLVDQLEGAMDTADIHDRALVDPWYDSWTPLADFDAGSSHELSVDYADIRPAIEALRSFLKETLWASEHPALSPAVPARQ